MGRRAATFKKRDVRTLVEAVSDAGCEVVRVEIDKSGKIVVVTDKKAVAESTSSDWDEVLHGSDAA